jgi:hypothetical protein
MDFATGGVSGLFIHVRERERESSKCVARYEKHSVCRTRMTILGGLVVGGDERLFKLPCLLDKESAGATTGSEVSGREQGKTKWG